MNRPMVSSGTVGSNSLVLIVELADNAFFHGFELVDKEENGSLENGSLENGSLENRSFDNQITTSIAFKRSTTEETQNFGDYFETGSIKPKNFHGISSQYASRRHYLKYPVQAKMIRITLHGGDSELERIPKESGLVFKIFGGNAEQCNSLAPRGSIQSGSRSKNVGNFENV